MSTLRALVVVYYWPPSGGPGVQRGVKLVAHLRRHGIEPTVLTVDPACYRLPGEYAPDPTLAAEVPEGVRVVRTAPVRGAALRETLARLRLLRLAHHVAPGALFERQAGWLAPLEAALFREVEHEEHDVVLTSSQPYVVHLAGMALRRETLVPWVADFRDPWTLSWGRSWPSWRAFRWEERREEEVLRDADRVVANTPGTRAEWLERRPWLDPRKVAVVRNGYDPEDLLHAGDVPPRDASLLRIVHAGSFRARPPARRRSGVRAALDRRGPEPVPYDLQTHSPEPLLRALAALGDAARRFRLRLVGSVDRGWLDLAASLGVADLVETTGYLPHRPAAAELLGADLLWLPTITRRDGGAVSNVPAKTYEYLGSGRPLLAYAGPGDVTDTLAGRERCLRVAPGPAAHDELTGALRGFLEHGLPPSAPPDPEDARPYRRDETARGIADVLRAAAGAPALDPVPAAAEDAPRP